MYQIIIRHNIKGEIDFFNIFIRSIYIYIYIYTYIYVYTYILKHDQARYYMHV